MAWSGKASRPAVTDGRAGTGTPEPPPGVPTQAAAPPAAHTTNTQPEGTALQGKAWRDAVKAATSALHAAQRRQAGRYVKVADRAAGSQYRPGQNRRGA